MSQHTHWQQFLLGWYTVAEVLGIAVIVALPVYTQTTTDHGQTRLNFLPSTSCYSRPFDMARVGESKGARRRGAEGRMGGTTSRTPFPSDSSSYYCHDATFETKQQQRLPCVCLLKIIIWAQGWTYIMPLTLPLTQWPLLVIQTLLYLHQNKTNLSQNDLF